MQANESDQQKSTVEHLNFGQKTAKRVSWESWEFTVVGPHLVRVTNASYGYLKDDHSYTVGIEDRNGVAVPAECDCPADKYREEYDCKHKVSLATVGGPVVMEAAIDFQSPEPETNAQRELKADGGLPAESGSDPRCDCPELGGFPCWPCVRSGNRDLPK